MAKKETKKKEKQAKKDKAKAQAAPAAPGTPPVAGTQAPAGKGKKSKTKKGKQQAAPAVDTSKLTAEQLTQVQIEEAIKESQDPSSRLRKLRSPLSVRGCLLNILILVVLTIAIVIFVCWLKLDHETFNLGVVLKDMLHKKKKKKHSVMNILKAIGNFFKKIFT